MKPLFKAGSAWTFDLLQKFDDLGKKYIKELGFDYYPLQIEVVSAEQMISLYSSHAMPLMYNHWSFGRNYLRDYQNYSSGKRGLAYEICLNSDPCLCYVMEDNNAMMQASVIWHVYGHSSHFASNYLKRDGDAENILNYMEQMRDYIKSCEDKYGVKNVEVLIDKLHSLQYNGFNKYKRGEPLPQVEMNKIRENTILESSNPFSKTESVKPEWIDKEDQISDPILLPEENLLYFIEKYSKTLKPWEKRIVNYVRHMSQYWYSSLGQTSVMAEATAMFVERYMVDRAHEEGYIDQGSYIEYLKDMGGVLYQIEIGKNIPDERVYDILLKHGKFNPYFLGYQMYSDIKRMCESPTEEDKQFRPEICGKDWKLVLKDVISNYRDESFIRQFLSPHLIKKLKIMSVDYHTNDEKIYVMGHHEEKYFKKVRNDLADQYLIGNMLPDIEISIATEDRILLTYNESNGMSIHQKDAALCIKYLSELTGRVVNSYF